MKDKLYLLGLAVILSALVLSGCAAASAGSGNSADVPDPAVARDAAMGIVAEEFGVQPAGAIQWQEADATPEGLLGVTGARYQADGWTVTVSYPLVRPDLTIYTVVVSNGALGIQWEGKLNMDLQVVE